MNKPHRNIGATIVTALVLAITACGGSENEEITEEITEETTEETTEEEGTTSNLEIRGSFKAEYFRTGAIIEDVSIVDCTLSGGTEAQCYQVVIAGTPVEQEVGPFCPPNIASEADEGGIWFDGSGELYDINGNFIVNLPTIYADDEWVLYDESGNVNITDTIESCEGAAQPNVEEEFMQHCVECELSYLEGGAVTKEFLIPVTPVPLEEPDSIGTNDLGVTLNGGPLSGPAPVDAILANYTIAAFDDCAGHINVTQGYHFHGAAGCNEFEQEGDGHAALIGYIQDGYPLFAMLDSNGEEAEGLDECRGHEDDARGYHYHTASTEENMFIGCYHGEQSTISEMGGGPPGGPPAEG